MRRFAHYSFVVSLVWLTFVVAISFVEAPAKFEALQIKDTTVVTPALQHALAIGHVVFHRLNRIEWVCCAFSWLLLLPIRVVRTLGSVALLALATAVLAFQTWALYPTMDARVAEILVGRMPPPSSYHVWFVVGEVVKVITLGVLAAAQVQAFARAVLSD